MRIVSLLPAATDIVRALGLGPSLVARTHQCAPDGESGNPPIVTRPGPPDAPERCGFAVDWAAVEALSPDVVITRAAAGHAAAVGGLVALPAQGGGRVYGLEAMDLEGVWVGIRALAGTLGDPAAGDRLTVHLRARIDAIAERVAPLRHRPVAIALEQLEIPVAAGGWVPEQIALAGGTPVLAEPGAAAVETQWEAVADCQPELFLAMPAGCDVLASLSALEALGARSDTRWFWKEIPAAYLDQIYALDALHDFGGPGPGLVDGIETLAGLLHPNLFPAPLATHALRP